MFSCYVFILTQSLNDKPKVTESIATEIDSVTSSPEPNGVSLNGALSAVESPEENGKVSQVALFSSGRLALTTDDEDDDDDDEDDEAESTDTRSQSDSKLHTQWKVGLARSELCFRSWWPSSG